MSNQRTIDAHIKDLKLSLGCNAIRHTSVLYTEREAPRSAQPTSQRNDLLCRVHDGTLCTNGPSYDIVGFCEVDNHDFLLAGVLDTVDVLSVHHHSQHLKTNGPHLLPRADEAVALHCQGVEANAARLDPHSR